MSRKTWEILAWLGTLGLAGVMLAWPIQSLDEWGLWLGLALVMPLLLLPVRGLIRNNRRAMQGSILLQALYLAIGLTEVVANTQARGWAMATLLLSLLLCACFLTLIRIPRD